MSEAKFTKAPWDYIGDHIVGVVGECDCPVERYEKDERGLPLQFYPDRAHESHDVVKPVIEDDLPEGVTIETYIANCHLIAAAPELLESLNAVVGEIKKYHPTFDARLFVEAERAIAKAKGE